MEMESTTKKTKPHGDDSDHNDDGSGGEPSMGNNYKYCFFFARKFGSTVLQPPADVKDSFTAYSGGAPQMTAAQLRRFLLEGQGEEGVTLDDAERIVEQLCRRHEVVKLGSKPAIDLEDFLHFLMSAELNPPIRSEVHQDMTAPLSHYYIYTGHNSYLTGNQLSSDCSERPIIKALQRGVRVIELDMWPNAAKDNVHVLHGRTLTSPVDMIRCLQSIKEFAFCASPYPVVITLEDHLTQDLQAKVAEMVTQTFGDMLFYPPSEDLKEFPSPNDLKNRIIISTKPPKEYLESKKSKDKEDDDQKVMKSNEEEAWGNDISNPKIMHNKDVHERQDQCYENSEDDDDDDDESQNSAPEYRRIITVQAGKPEGRMRDALKVDPEKVRRLSLSEQKLAKAAESHGDELVRFTQRNILRVYPKGTRFNSSNYNPLISWMHGAQMVAFNMQGYGKSLWLMQGLFRANGGCGYVKKPDFLLKKGPYGEVFDPERSLPVRKTLKVKVHMGDGWRVDFSKTHFDTFSPPDFYVRIGIAGVPADCIMKKTKIKEDDWVPVWDEEFSFALTVPELALLRVEVHEYDRSEKDDFGGQTCLPVWELRPGMRAVPLYDRKGNKYNSVRLLMRFAFV